MIDYESLDRDQLLIREQILRQGIYRLRRHASRRYAPRPNIEWIDSELAAIEGECDAIRDLRERKFTEDLEAARTALKAGDEAVVDFLLGADPH